MKQLLFLISILIFARAEAQLYYVPLKERIESSELIVEGRVISTHSYWDDRNKVIYTSNLVEVYSILKGQTNEKQIQIITLGGTVDDICLEAFHFLGLSRGAEGMFFCIPTQRYVNNTTIKAYDIYAEEQGFLQYFDDKVNAPIGNKVEKFQSKEKELYPIIESISKQRIVKKRKNKAEQLLENWLNSNKILSTQDDDAVFYHFENPTITGSGFQYLEFDITSEATNLFEFESARLYIQYDTTAFGTSISTSGGITVTKESIILSPDYVLSVSDSTNGLIKIDVSNVSTANLYNIGTNSERLCHIKMSIATIFATVPNIQFVQNLMQWNTRLYDNINNTSFNPYVIAVDSITSQWTLLLPPHILYIDPNTVTGGTGDFIAIHGDNFGNSKGRISFLDADLGNGIRTFAGSADILLWMDTLILVNVYSMDTTISTGSKHNSAGSGYVLLEKSGGQKDSSYIYRS